MTIDGMDYDEWFAWASEVQRENGPYEAGDNDD